MRKSAVHDIESQMAGVMSAGKYSEEKPWVNDKRVSRNHGILENVDGRLRLKPTHVNPCFIQESLEATPQPLEKDTWHCLKDGSIFSLLPGKYIYRVHAIGEEGTLGNSQGYEEDMEAQIEIEQDPKPSRSCEETQAYTPQPRNSVSFTTKIKDGTQTLDPDIPNQVDAAMSTTNVPDPLIHQRKRVLPAWMLATSSVAHSPSTTKAAAPKRAPKQMARNPAPSKHAAGPKRERRKHEVSLSGDEDEDKWEDEECSEVEPMPRKRARKLESDLEDSQDQAPAQKTSEDKTFKVEEVSVDERKEEEGKARASEGAEGTSGSRTESSRSVPESSGNSQVKKLSSQDVQQLAKVAGSAQVISSNAKAKSQRRNPCPYGTSCYRKNPIHFQECSHPGDDDYEEEQNEDDEDDDRPECPYGTDCYRKNPLHKKEYKHTKPPAPIKKPTSRADDDDDDDDDRYEDSFINDESEEEEVDEDSDYVPESEDSGAEDVKQLQKEAKTFLRRKK